MRNRAYTKILFLCIGVFFTPAPLVANLVRQNQRFDWDAQNWLAFEDFGREETTHSQPGFQDSLSITHGMHIVLHVFRDGRERVIDLPTDGERSLSTQVREIHYRDRNHAWLISRLGRRLDGAVLVDLRNGKLVKELVGGAFSLSPDRKRMAYAYPYGSTIWSRAGVYLEGNTRLFPRVETGLAPNEQLGAPRPAEGDDFPSDAAFVTEENAGPEEMPLLTLWGDSAGAALFPDGFPSGPTTGSLVARYVLPLARDHSFEVPPAALITPIRWMNKETLEWGMAVASEEMGGDQLDRYIHVLVELPEGFTGEYRDNGPKPHVTCRSISALEALDLRTSIEPSFGPHAERIKKERAAETLMAVTK